MIFLCGLFLQICNHPWLAPPCDEDDNKADDNDQNGSSSSGSIGIVDQSQSNNGQGNRPVIQGDGSNNGQNRPINQGGGSNNVQNRPINQGDGSNNGQDRPSSGKTIPTQIILLTLSVTFVLYIWKYFQVPVDPMVKISLCKVVLVN